MKYLVAIITLMITCVTLHGQQTSAGLPYIQVVAQTGVPVSTCSSINAGYIVIQTDATNGRLWICDNSSGSWAWDHLINPFIATGTTGVITPPTVIGCTSGTATVSGATTSNTAIASPIGSPGTGQINTTAYVSAANTVTVTLCLPLTVSYTANPVAYKVLVF